MTKIEVPLLIVQVGQTGLTLYAPHLSDLVRADYLPETMRDLEVANQQNLHQLFNQLVTQYQIPYSRVATILESNIYFAKETGPLSPADQQSFVSNFSLSVPLENAFTHLYMFKDRMTVVAFNRALIITLVEAYKKLQFLPEVLLPDLILHQQLGLTNLSLETAQSLAENLDKLTKYNLLGITAEEKGPAEANGFSDLTGPRTDLTARLATQANTAKMAEAKRTSPRVYLLAGVLVFLALVLAVVFVMTLTSGT